MNKSATMIQLNPQDLLRDVSDNSVLSVYHRAMDATDGGRYSYEEALRSGIMPQVAEGQLIVETMDDPDVRTCRGCGCTDEYACTVGCYWDEPDLCSTCKARQSEQ